MGGLRRLRSCLSIFDEALRLCRHGIEIARSLDEQAYIGNFLRAVSQVFRDRGDLEEALKTAQETVKVLDPDLKTGQPIVAPPVMVARADRRDRAGDVVTRPDSRDAPHLFGLGLKEMLGDQITADLRAKRDTVVTQARASGTESANLSSAR